ncbi:MAG TPA: DHHA1 domain-containing protein, partial [bacterium]|nr:DHHA1 domain-containing protein [bacterium]
RVEYMIPAPDDDYDISPKIADYAKENNIALIITVDCGISAFDTAAKISEYNIDLIITDHHEPQDTLPNAYTILNPKQIDCEYPDKMLAGCGVALKLASAIILYFSRNNFFFESDADNLKKISSAELLKNYNYKLFLRKYLPIAAIGSIADVVPLANENRIITKLGYDILKAAPPLFAKILFEKLGIEKISGNTIGFKIAPLLNASRRMKKISYSLDFLLTDDKAQLYALCEYLMELNKLRKIKTDEFYEIAVADAETQIEKENTNVVILKYSQFEHGVTGLVANKLRELFNCPIFLFVEEDGILGGAGRADGNINLVETLSNFKEYLIKFGGHKYAVGLSMTLDNFENFKKAMIEYFAKFEMISKDKMIEIDTDLLIDDINFELLDYLKILEPFGTLNEEPIFYCENMRIKYAKAIGADNRHLSITLQSSVLSNLRAVLWNKGDLINKLTTNQNISAVFTLEENIFRNVRYAQLKIIEILI